MKADIRMTYLYGRYVDKTISPAEFDELLVWLYGLDETSSATLSESQRSLWEKAKAGELDHTAGKVDWDRVFHNVLNTDTKKAPVRKLWPRVAAAAAILLFLAIGSFYFFSRNKTAPPIAQDKPVERKPETILPNSNFTILTLADGRQIILDSAATGNLATGDETNVVKLQNGEIAYQSKATTARPEIHTIRVPRGGRPYQLLLADGSKIWLNAASSLSYPSFFNGDTRQVQLTGEAYFEVAKNTAMPFHVSYNNMDVEVLGTHFNVMAYEDEASVQTTLLEGLVKVTNGNSAVFVKPGQQANLKNEALKVEAANTDLAVAWVKGYFQFDKADLKTILRQVGRWYDLEIVYTGTVPPDLFSGKIERNLPLTGIIKLLDQGNIRIKVEGKKLLVL